MILTIGSAQVAEEKDLPMLIIHCWEKYTRVSSCSGVWFSCHRTTPSLPYLVLFSDTAFHQLSGPDQAQSWSVFSCYLPHVGAMAYCT